MGTNFWEGIAYAPHERSERFLEMMFYLYDPDFPVEGTDVTGSFLLLKDPEYTVVVLKVSLHKPTCSTWYGRCPYLLTFSVGL